MFHEKGTHHSNASLTGILFLKIINHCRHYLHHVTTVSEIFNVEGNKILPHMFQYRRPPWLNKHQFIIIQRRPSDYKIRHQRQRLCRQWCTHDGTSAAYLDFGEWIHQCLGLRTRRESYITRQQEVYHWINSCYWFLEQSSTTTICYNPGRATNWIPDNHATPISVTRSSQPNAPAFAIEYRTYAPPPNQYLYPSLQLDFHDHLQQLPESEWEQHLLQNVQFHCGAFSTMSYIHDTLPPNQPIYVLSDGSTALDTTSFGWMRRMKAGQRLARCKGPASGPAHRTEQSAGGNYRSQGFFTTYPISLP
jgi:hypothetical protein